MEMNQYLDVFLDESREHLQNMNKSLLELEQNPSELQLVNDIFRAAHTIKGMSATMGYDDMAHLTHQLENILDMVRNGKRMTDSQIIDVLFEATDHLDAMLEDIAEQGDGKRDVSLTIAKLSHIESQENVNDHSELGATTINTAQTDYNEFDQTVIMESLDQGYNVYEIEISLKDDCILKSARVYMIFEVLEQVGEVIKSVPTVEKLEEEVFDKSFCVTAVTKISESEIKARILKVSEIESVKVNPLDGKSFKDGVKTGSSQVKEQTLQSEVGEYSSPDRITKEKSSQNTSTNKTIRVNIDRLDQLMNLFEELVIDRGRLDELSRELNVADLTDTVERMSRVSSDLQNIILNLRMVPIDQVFNRFPRMVRSLAKELHKKIHIEMIGNETELDRTVIDEIGDPLVHILRNSIDHGIETPEERKKRGKKEEGTITLKAYHSGNHVFIGISDDGAGINKEKVIQKAVDNGLIFAGDTHQLSDSEIYQLMFLPGFSTADQISDISGRGVGLDVVRNKIESLGGVVIVDSEEDKGTTFTIQLPLTLSIIAVMLVEINNEKYAIPLSSILETAIIKHEEILFAHHQPVIRLRDHVVPLIFLGELLDVPGYSENKDYLSLVIVKKGTKVAALVVDTFIGQQEIVIKPLGHFLNDVFALSGATILGDGQVALILDSNALIK